MEGIDMSSFFKWVFWGLTISAVAIAVIALIKHEEITRLLAVNSLFSQEKIVNNFSSMDKAFLTVPLIRAVDDPAPLAQGPTSALPTAVDDWIIDRAVTALVVLKGGDIVYEDYFQGTAATDLRINWSVSKSYLSALLGVLVSEGVITDLDALVTDYAPELAGSAYAATSIRNVLQMSSGVTFNEDYLDQSSDINRMGRVLALGRSMDGFTANLTETDATPGDHWQYVSIDTHVIGMVIRGATGRSITDLLVEKIIGPMRFEADPYFLTDGYGVAFVLGGLNTTTRDNARFGQMFAQGACGKVSRFYPPIGSRKALPQVLTQRSARLVMDTNGGCLMVPPPDSSLRVAFTASTSILIRVAMSLWPLTVPTAISAMTVLRMKTSPSSALSQKV